MLSLGDDTLNLDDDDKDDILGYKDTLRMYKVLHPIHRQDDFE